ncbi:MAG: DUF2723 domain-containing protein [Candidatus Aegiribacteria sp.]|nr:DUF2723 domain-containing protein [Candidatus Aegiribacteria sp.]MBD3295544.1 DUF2723 domain-containing protein [Candidatus Fermentibacteria bacterium]
MPAEQRRAVAVHKRSLLLLLPLLAAATTCFALFTGSGSFDFIDGTEFVICGRNLDLPHPPGYPLYIFLMRVFSIVFPCARLDYGCFRILSALIAGGCSAAGYAALRSFGRSRVASLLGSFMLFSLAPVMAQMNVVEVHGFAMMLVLAALALRRSPLGPYAFSMSIFAGHPVTAVFLPSALSRSYRRVWVLMAAIPASLWLFVPLRSAFPGLSHYSRPETLDSIWQYFTLYGSRLSFPEIGRLMPLVASTGAVSLAVLAFTAVFSRTWSWKLFLTFAAGTVFVASYSIPDTSSIIWIPLLPLAIWSTSGLDRLFRAGSASKAAAIVLVGVSAVSGLSMASRRGDHSASVMARDYLRGAGPEAVFVSTGMVTFHTAYLLEVEDRRPDILPMDAYRCFYRIQPPAILSETISGRQVYATRAWDNPLLQLCGLLFTGSPETVPWEIFDSYRYSGPIHDGFASDQMAELWALRGIQSSGSEQRDFCRMKAMEYAESGMVKERIGTLFDLY